MKRLACVAALLAASVAQAAVPTTIAVTITDSQIRLPQTPVRIGQVTFKVANRSKLARDFRIGGKKTARIAPGKSATLRVTFTKTGLAVYSSRALRGVLTFVDPCVKPASTTLSVTMSEAPATLSRTTVPCGAVTFSVTNAGTLPHSFRIGTHTGAQLQPGETASLTVQLTQKGRAFYRCGEPEHDELYGETGWVTVV